MNAADVLADVLALHDAAFEALAELALLRDAIRLRRNPMAARRAGRSATYLRRLSAAVERLRAAAFDLQPGCPRQRRQEQPQPLRRAS